MCIYIYIYIYMYIYIYRFVHTWWAEVEAAAKEDVVRGRGRAARPGHAWEAAMFVYVYVCIYIYIYIYIYTHICI